MTSLDSTPTADRSQDAPSPPRDRGAQSRTRRFGIWIAEHRRAVLLAWLVTIVGALVLAPVFVRSLGTPSYKVGGSGSARADDLIARHLGDVGSQNAIVFSSQSTQVGQPAFDDVITHVLQTVHAHPGVSDIVSPLGPGGAGQVSADKHSAFAIVGLPGSGTQQAKRAKELQALLTDASHGRPVTAALTGFVPLNNDLVIVENHDLETAELIGVPIALLVLLVALGSVTSAILPLLSAGLGVLITYGLLGALTPVTHFDSLVPSLISMIGIGVGIDYAMFLVSRFREELGRGVDVSTATGTTLATVGRTVMASAVVVMTSLGALVVVRSHLFREVAIGAALAVFGAVLVAVTLLPAILAMLGQRLAWGSLPRRLQPAEVTGREADEGFWGHWARTLMRRRVVSSLIVIAVLLAAAAPLLGMHLGINFGVAAVSDTPSGRALATLTKDFDPGLVSPTQVVVAKPAGALDAAELMHIAILADAIQHDSAVGSVVSLNSLGASIPGMADVTYEPAVLRRLRADPTLGPLMAPIYARDGSATVIEVAPKAAIDSPRAGNLVKRIRNELIPVTMDGTGLEARVGGVSALTVDFSHEMNRSVPIVLGIVLSISLLFLLVVFRSVLLATKAVVMNLLATGAAFGLLVIVFQHGVGQGVLGFISPGYIQTYLPIMVFVLLFGLSMDYEVFLVRRIQESWIATGDNARAVAEGLEHTARPISAAAAIMVAVFGSFLTVGVLEIKQFGFGLAVAIAIDATLIRLVLVPAVMDIAGRWNWWVPDWLARRLPRVDLD